MSLRQLLLALRARYKIALAVMLLTIAVGIPVVQHLPKQYTATTSLVVDVRSPDPIASIMMPSNMATQEDIIKSDRVARKVVKLLRLDENPTVQAQWRGATGGRGTLDVWLAELLQKRLVVAPFRRDSNIITIEYSAADPAFAASVANGFAQAYMETAVELKVDPAKQYARWFGEQGKALRENVEKAQARLSEYQQKKGIVARDESLDTETARLAQLTEQLTALQAETTGARSRQRVSSAGTLPEVMQSAVVQGLRSDIARQEARLKEMRVNLGSNHPQILRLQSEIQELKARLEAETRHVASSFSTTNSVGRDREKELLGAIEAQKKKLLALRSERDELAVLQRDVDAAKNAYEAVARRYTQTSLESQATQTNVFLLTPAVEPLEPSSPKVPKFTLMVVILGAALGFGAALGLELIDRRVRSVEDLAEMLQLPVLVVIPRMPVRRSAMARLAFWRDRPALPAP
jgi:chain length determinant protein EpsF